ncbi:unnamed protein product [Nezara viridula]|uniref:Serine/threonine-protein kinase PLK n=1 Tax=Nezara viridula TaxID=85310 RepID=A0A9P0HJ51_NEZVI|nr:unnamed protein product [Nezara viridula]
MSKRNTEDDKPIPDIVFDSNSKTTYKKGQFLGKGGFAKCYELREVTTNGIFAGKIVSKRLLTNQKEKEKMSQEIQIHKSLRHKNIVLIHSYFDDPNFVYIILELCRKRSMMELHKRRKALSEPEVRYYMKQILEGVVYLHGLQIIHRDLKLGNLFLNDDLEVKIGDFGLAAKIEYNGQRKKTLCGTPNYIAPEILTKQGHSYEVDVWSIGCIMYTLLVGKPPFETNSLRETYAKITRCEYTLPSSLNAAAAYMLNKMLQPDPSKRPTVRQLQEMEFMKTGYCPDKLPPSCLTMLPRFDNVEVSIRKPLIEVNANEPQMVRSSSKKPEPRISVFGACSVPQTVTTATAAQCNQYLRQLHHQLVDLLKKRTPVFTNRHAEEMSDPAAQPFVWISKWVDYSDKYGFGYQLCDDGVGVMFNDSTRLVLLPNHMNVHYIEKDGSEHYHLMGQTPPHLEKKMKLLSYFRRYMTEFLMKAGDSVKVQESDNLSRIPYLHMWHRSSSGVLMQLTNGTVQINFMNHTKIIICPLMAAVTYIDVDKNFRTYRFTTLAKEGFFCEGLYNNLRYALTKTGEFLQTKA